jgi:hypothetical protein
VDPPGPLSDLQLVTDKERLITSLIDIYNRNNVEYETAKLRESLNQAAKGLFGRLEEFVSYPRVYFIAKDADFAAHPDLPADNHGESYLSFLDRAWLGCPVAL